MGRTTLLQNEAGFTLLEILVGALVFMIGFSIVIGVLNGTLVKLHVDELTQAGAVGQMIMEQTVASRDTTALDTVIVRSARQLQVTRRAHVENDVAGVEVAVSRPGSGRVLMRWYCEFTTSAQ